MAGPIPLGVAIARAENSARVLFRPSEPPPRLEDVFASLRADCESAAQVLQLWDLVQIRLAEMQASADGFPVKHSINERAA